MKLVMKSQTDMDFTSNLRVSSKGQIISNFYNKNSFFRVILPQNDIFQSETSQLSISSITYPNRFKVLPEYLKARYITTFFMYSNQNIILSEMQINSNDKKLDLSKDIYSVISLDPLVLVRNLNKMFENEKIEWIYSNQNHRINIKTSNNAYVLKNPQSIAILLGFQEDDISFVNDMTVNHLCKDTWLYKVF